MAATPGSARQDLSTSAVFSSRVHFESSGVACGGTNSSNNSTLAIYDEDEGEGEENETMAFTSPREVTILYRYFNKELTRLLMGRGATLEEGSVPGRRDKQLIV